MAVQLRPDVIFMDIVLPGEMYGIHSAERVNEQFNIPIIITATRIDE